MSLCMVAHQDEAVFQRIKNVCGKIWVSLSIGICIFLIIGRRMQRLILVSVRWKLRSSFLGRIGRIAWLYLLP